MHGHQVLQSFDHLKYTAEYWNTSILQMAIRKCGCTKQSPRALHKSDNIQSKQNTC